MTAPVEHIVDAHKTTSDREVSLWEISLKDGGVALLRNGPKVTWQGKTYENMPIILTGDEVTADDKTTRPTLRIYNPKKIFGPWAHQGRFDRAIVIRKTVLQANIVANLPIFQQRVWLLSQITAMTDDILQTQLRNTSDGPNMNVPFRYYGPPDFPFVSF